MRCGFIKSGWSRGFFALLSGAMAWAVSIPAVLADAAGGAPSAAQQRAQQLYQSIVWEKGPCLFSVGSNAEIQVPAGFQITGQAGTAAWNELNENPPSNDLAVLMPTDSADWFVAFSFDDVGYVSEDEKGKLDADAILKSIREGTEQSNVYRRDKGWPELHIQGWSHAPAYDEATKNLIWAIRSKDSMGGEGINYNTRILGRRGVMSATLVVSTHGLDAAVPTVKTLLTEFHYKAGNKYSEWVSGDKVAEYGLTGLITGGLVVGAAKTGLLGKLVAVIAKGGKAIIAVLAAAGMGIWKLLTSFGSRKQRSG